MLLYNCDDHILFNSFSAFHINLFPNSFSIFLFSCGGMQLGNDVTSHVLAVIGLELTESAFLQLIADKVSASID